MIIMLWCSVKKEELRDCRQAGNPKDGGTFEVGPVGTVSVMMAWGSSRACIYTVKCPLLGKHPIRPDGDVSAPAETSCPKSGTTPGKWVSCRSVTFNHAVKCSRKGRCTGVCEPLLRREYDAAGVYNRQHLVGWEAGAG